MKIKKIEFENFRQFKNRNIIELNEKDSINLIYGKNGNGKTTFHQLLQWIFYGNVNFNKTTTDKLYNLSYDEELNFGEQMSTWGKVDFSYNGNDYSLFREIIYKKDLVKIREVNNTRKLLKMDETGNWKPLVEKDNEIQKFIEMLLPGALTDYFFFDGENMIADLKKTGRASAKSLRSSLFSMFDLSYLESAILHIGNTDKTNTAIGSLYMNKEIDKENFKANDAKEKMLFSEKEKNKFKENMERYSNEIANAKTKIKDISETIGKAKSNKEYEKERNRLLASLENENKKIKNDKLDFGTSLYEVYPKILLKKRFEIAKSAVNDKINESGKDLPYGLEKKLIETLLSEDRKTCICGNCLGKKEKDNLEKYLRLFPPYSYSALYNSMITMFDNIGRYSDEERVDSYFSSISNSLSYCEDCRHEIESLDEEKRKNKDVQKLIDDRAELENQQTKYEEKYAESQNSFFFANRIYVQEKKKYDESLKKSEKNDIIDKKILILKKVKQLFENDLTEYADKYSKELRINIENLLEEMLTSKRSVEVTNEFMVKIFDSYGDESKSEGQFAVISFAYIGAILRLLKNEDALKEKEFPLVLDGPFSKLDENQKRNVINQIPKFASQVLLFSKDLLSEYMDENNCDKAWLIYSNEEKNYSEIRLASKNEIDYYFEIGGDVI